MVVEVDVIIYQRFRHGKIFDFLAVDTFRFQDAKEVFSHGVVVTISVSSIVFP